MKNLILTIIMFFCCTFLSSKEIYRANNYECAREVVIANLKSGYRSIKETDHVFYNQRSGDKYKEVYIYRDKKLFNRFIIFYEYPTNQYIVFSIK